MKLSKKTRKKVILGIMALGITYGVFSNSIYGEGYKNERIDGRKSVVAIIDSGIDVNDSSFANINSKVGKIDKGFVERIKGELHAKDGKYINEKIPFAYDYSDKDSDVKNDSNSHGTHVAGIAAGNGSDVYGVAPNAQILAMKVFSDNPEKGASMNLIADAVNDAVRLKADAINISIGSRSGALRDIPARLKEAIDEAVKKGVVVNIAAGNDGFYSWGANNPLPDNPDYATVSSPSIYSNSFSVASSNARTVKENKIIVKTKSGFADILKNPVKGAYKFVSQNDRDFENREYGFSVRKLSDYKNKIAIIRLKKENLESINKKIAEVKNSSGIIIISEDNKIGKIEGINSDVPVIMISKKDGNSLFNHLNNTSIYISGESSSYDELSSIKPSEFSSWGYSPEFGVKPEIMAYGGGVFSAINDSKRAFANGTSMATPQVTGAIALMSQRYADIPEKDRYKVFKNILMSTAVPSKEENSFNYISPRKQGAGNLNIDSALNAGAYIVDSRTGESKINLGEIRENKINLDMNLKNIGKDRINYEVSVFVNTDKVENGRISMKPYNLLEYRHGKVSLDGNSEQPLKIEIDFSKPASKIESKFKNGYFVEGYAVLKDKNNSKNNISIPFVGFKGEWSKLNAIEDSIYELGKKDKTVYGSKIDKGFTHFASKIDNTETVLGEINENGRKKYDVSRLAISPNEDKQQDDISFKFIALRNYKNLKMEVTDKNGNSVYSSGKEGLSGKKNLYSNIPGSNILSSNTKLRWNGKKEVIDDDDIFADVKYENIDDGEYNLKISYESEDSKEKSGLKEKQYRILVDTKKPEIDGYVFKNGKLTVKAIDELSGIKEIKMENVKNKVIRTSFGESVSIDAKSLEDVKITVYDNAMNMLVINGNQLDKIKNTNIEIKESKNKIENDRKESNNADKKEDISRKYLFDEMVDIKDKNIRRNINDQLGKNSHDKIYRSDLEKITSIGSEESPVAFVSSLKGLENSKVKEIHLKENRIYDIEEFKRVKNLEKLYLKDSFNLDISSIAKIENLKNLSLINCGIKEISPLANMKKLQKLDVSNNLLKGMGLLKNSNIEITALNQKVNHNITELISDIPLDYKDLSVSLVELPKDISEEDVKIENNKIIISKEGELYKKIEKLTIDSEPLTGTVKWKSKDGKFTGTAFIEFDSTISLNELGDMEFGDFEF